MLTKQISILIDNRPGRLARVTALLRDAGVNIRAISMADAPDFGIFRLVVDDTTRALKALKEGGFLADVSDVVAVELVDKPGALAAVLALLARGDVNIEYMYASLAEEAGKAVVYLRFEDSLRALAVLRDGGARILEQ
ncbi:MAG: ACT domain-containing protein [Chloroflexi bacterium]|nr:ACT domain-containing protein [Chloroflexota bacterium]